MAGDQGGGLPQPPIRCPVRAQVGQQPGQNGVEAILGKLRRRGREAETLGPEARPFEPQGPEPGLRLLEGGGWLLRGSTSTRCGIKNIWLEGRCACRRARIWS